MHDMRVVSHNRVELDLLLFSATAVSRGLPVEEPCDLQPCANWSQDTDILLDCICP